MAFFFVISCDGTVFQPLLILSSAIVLSEDILSIWLSSCLSVFLFHTLKNKLGQSIPMCPGTLLRDWVLDAEWRSINITHRKTSWNVNALACTGFQYFSLVIQARHVKFNFLELHVSDRNDMPIYGIHPWVVRWGHIFLEHLIKWPGFQQEEQVCFYV